MFADLPMIPAAAEVNGTQKGESRGENRGMVSVSGVERSGEERVAVVGQDEGRG